MAYKRKYCKGAQVKSVDEFLKAPGNQYFIWHGKTLHKQVLLHWQVETLDRLIREGWIFFADRCGDGGE